MSAECDTLLLCDSSFKHTPQCLNILSFVCIFMSSIVISAFVRNLVFLDIFFQTCAINIIILFTSGVHF